MSTSISGKYSSIFAIFVCAWFCAYFAAAKSPNIVIIMADDLGYGDLSSYGGWIDTPHLDALAASGLRFTDFHSSGNVCSPTRAALMTGRYPHRAGLSQVVYAAVRRPEYFHGMQDVEWTLGEAFQAEDYTTALFGKWHLGYHPEFNPTRHGFDHFRGFVSGNIDYRSHIDSQGRKDWWHDDTLVEEPGYLTELITKHAVSFIESHKESPFLLYLPHHAPHYPFQGPKDPAERTVDGEFEHIGSEPDKKRAYREMVESMDQSIGNVMDTLRKHSLHENTLVWFMSDNGAARWGSNTPLNGSKGTDWEGGHRVPAIAYWPGQIEPGVTDALICTMDVMPTVLNVIDAKESPKRRFDGLDVTSTLFQNAQVGSREIYWNRGGNARRGGAVREDQWKLLVAFEQRTLLPPKLFDLSTDLGEQNDLSKRHPERTSEMKAKLDAWLVEMDRTATPQPEPPNE